jgi:hypothetical protein
MKLACAFRVALGIILAILAGWSCLGILGSFLVPCECDMTTTRYFLSQVFMATGFALVAAVFAWAARWCFTGRGFKKREI